MHRWRTELFRHLVHSLEVDLCVAEQRQIDLSAHRGLRPLRIEPSALSDETPKAMRPPPWQCTGGFAFLDSNAPSRLLKMQLKWALASGWRCLRV